MQHLIPFPVAGPYWAFMPQRGAKAGFPLNIGWAPKRKFNEIHVPNHPVFLGDTCKLPGGYSFYWKVLIFYLGHQTT